MSIRKLRNYDWPNLYIFEVPNVLNGYDYNNYKLVKIEATKEKAGVQYFLSDTP